MHFVGIDQHELPFRKRIFRLTDIKGKFSRTDGENLHRLMPVFVTDIVAIFPFKDKELEGEVLVWEDEFVVEMHGDHLKSHILMVFKDRISYP